MLFPNPVQNYNEVRLGWRPLLSVLCRRIYYTAVDRFCAPVASAAQLKDCRRHCMPDIFSQGEPGAFAFEPLVLVAASFMSGIGIVTGQRGPVVPR
jgi:hypothetical protein